jgi:hypothetical protein
MDFSWSESSHARGRATHGDYRQVRDLFTGGSVRSAGHARTRPFGFGSIADRTARGTPSPEALPRLRSAAIRGAFAVIADRVGRRS